MTIALVTLQACSMVFAGTDLRRFCWYGGCSECHLGERCPALVEREGCGLLASRHDLHVEVQRCWIVIIAEGSTAGQTCSKKVLVYVAIQSKSTNSSSYSGTYLASRLRVVETEEANLGPHTYKT